MDRSKTAPITLLVTSVGFLAWSLLLVSTPGGSRPVEWAQLIVSVATFSYSWIAMRNLDLAHNRKIRYVLLGYAVIGVVIVLGLAADQDSSRTWARLGWAALLAGYFGALFAWSRVDRFRPAVVAVAVVGAILIVSGFGITAKCDIAVQRSWCDANYEREQALAERVDVAGQLQSAGRAGGSQGAALMAYSVSGATPIVDLTSPPGEWTYEERPLQARDLQRGRYNNTQAGYADCKIDVRVEEIPAGTIETVLVTCGDSA